MIPVKLCSNRTWCSLLNTAASYTPLKTAVECRFVGVPMLLSALRFYLRDDGIYAELDRPGPDGVGRLCHVLAVYLELYWATVTALHLHVV